MENFKQIWFDEVTGKLIFLSEESEPYECDLYGDKLPDFYESITGMKNYSQRKELMTKEQFQRVIPKKHKFDNYKSYLPTISIILF